MKCHFNCSLVLDGPWAAKLKGERYLKETKLILSVKIQILKEYEEVLYFYLHYLNIQSPLQIVKTDHGVLGCSPASQTPA